MFEWLPSFDDFLWWFGVFHVFVYLLFCATGMLILALGAVWTHTKNGMKLMEIFDAVHEYKARHRPTHASGDEK